METGMLKLVGLNGPECAEHISNAIGAMPGVDNVNVSFDTSRATVLFNEDLVSIGELKVAVEQAGYRIKPAHGEDGACCGGCGG